MFDQIKKIHFVGIGGMGVSAIAKMMLDLKKIVSGSDLVASEITQDLEKRGAKIFLGHRKDNLNDGVDLVIYSPAVSKKNPERVKARALKIPVFSYPEFLGQLSKDKFTLAISGTHGKTTTTALTGLILEKAGFEPTVIVGSKVKNFPEGNFRFGRSRYLVVEACEWRAHMLNLSPQVIILTNLEKDHLDYYRNFKHIIKTFQKYIKQLSVNGFLVLNQDDLACRQLVKTNSRVVSYGIKNQAEIMAKNIVVKKGYQEFDLIHRSKFLIHIFLHIPGLFNIYNALAAATAAIKLGVDSEIIKEVLENYTGTWRRFEVKDWKIKKGQLKIISDYAHHPTAVKGTIKAAKEFYPNRRIFVVFQPHHRHRTKKLFHDFVQSFDEADLVIISEIYGVPGRESKEDENISARDLVEAILNRQKTITPFRANVFYAANLEETKKMILANLKENDIILIMGAGDIYTIIDKFLKC